MQSQNLSEYILVRKELQEVKNCITQYMGFVLGGSSLSFIGVWFSRRNGEDFLAPAYISLSLSIIVVLVLVILFYKFNSHNRFAGYRKLLIQEVWDDHPDGVEQFFGWEWCIAQLRDADDDPFHIIQLCDETEVDGLKDRLKTYYKDYGIFDPKDTIHTLETFYDSYHKKFSSKSWGFPLRIVAIFSVVVIIFLLMGYYFSIKLYLVNDSWFDGIVLGLVLLLVTVVQMRVWWLMAGTLHTLMHDDGIATVDAYSVRFLPIRHELLKKHHIQPEWNRLVEIR